MSDEHHGATLLLLQANKEFQNRMSIFAVEITGRFIRQEQGGPFARLRAMATRWRSPPESLEGK